MLQKSEIFKNISDTIVLRLFEKKLIALEDFKNVIKKNNKKLILHFVQFFNIIDKTLISVIKKY